MVFSNLPHHEKDAFFSLLDEYFQSRPELASALKSSAGSGNGNVDAGHVAGRVAAAASAFGNRLNSNSGDGATSPPPTRHVPTRSSMETSPAARGLISSQRLGDVDTSSKKSMVTSSLFSKMQHTPSTPTPVIPAALPARKNNFGPPPVHRKQPSPEPEPEPEPDQAQGEWAEALYDYEPSDANDLKIRANERILVTERTTDDWWTGQVDGRSGLFPATYVKLL